MVTVEYIYFPLCFGIFNHAIFEVYLPYEPSYSSVGRLVLIISKKVGKLHFHATIGALVFILLPVQDVSC